MMGFRQSLNLQLVILRQSVPWRTTGFSVIPMVIFAHKNSTESHILLPGWRGKLVRTNGG